MLEGNPALTLDHVALVPPITNADGTERGGGVWDKGGAVPLVFALIFRNFKTGTETMSDERPSCNRFSMPSADLRSPCWIARRASMPLKRSRRPKRRSARKPPSLSSARKPPSLSRWPPTFSKRICDEIAEVQSRADGVFYKHGEQAPPPMAAEDKHNYRIRLLRALQRHSKDFRNIDLRKIADATMFDVVENRIYADADEASKSPLVAEGHLREIKTRDETGRTISTFHGSPRVWMSDFSMQPMRVVGLRKRVEY